MTALPARGGGSDSPSNSLVYLLKKHHEVHTICFWVVGIFKHRNTHRKYYWKIRSS